MALGTTMMGFGLWPLLLGAAVAVVVAVAEAAAEEEEEEEEEGGRAAEEGPSLARCSTELLKIFSTLRKSS